MSWRPQPHSDWARRVRKDRRSGLWLLLIIILVGIVPAPSDAVAGDRDVPTWNYLVSYEDIRVEFFLRSANKPRVGESANVDGPVWFGRLFLLFGVDGRLPDSALGVMFLARVKDSNKPEPTVDEFVDELNDAADRSAIAKGGTALGRFSAGEFRIETLGDRRWYVLRKDACDLRYVTVLNERTIMQVYGFCGVGRRWQSKRKIDTEFRARVADALASARISIR